MSAKITTLLSGAERLVRELKLANPKTKARVVEAIKRNTRAIAAGAKARVHVLSGVTRSTIRDEYSSDGLTGYVKVGRGKLPRRSKATTVRGKSRFATAKRARKVGPGAWAPVLERGDKRTNRRAFPFLRPPFESQKPTAIADIDHALNDSLQEIT